MKNKRAFLHADILRRHGGLSIIIFLKILPFNKKSFIL